MNNDDNSSKKIEGIFKNCITERQQRMDNLISDISFINHLSRNKIDDIILCLEKITDTIITEDLNKFEKTRSMIENVNLNFENYHLKISDVVESIYLTVNNPKNLKLYTSKEDLFGRQYSDIKIENIKPPNIM